MNQQINLFLQLPRPKVETGKYTVKNMFIAAGIIVAVFFIYTIYINVKDHHLSNEVERLTEEKVAAQKKYDDTSAQYPAEAKAALVNQAKDVEQQIAVKKALLNILQNSSLGTNGFAEKLQALSDDVQPGMWLTSIEFNLSKHYIGLSGISTNVDAVLAFVDKLGKNPAFANEKFATFKMDKPEDDLNNNALSFVLSNDTGYEPPTPAVPAKAAPKPAPAVAAGATSPVASGSALNTNTTPAQSATKKSAVTMVPEEGGYEDSSEGSSKSGGSDE